MGRLYSNENFPLPVAIELRRRGHDVVTIQERGHAGEAASDPDVLAWAVGEQRAVLTLNRKHFIDNPAPCIAYLRFRWGQVAVELFC